MATESTTDFSLDSAAALAADEGGAIEGKSPWLLAWRRLRRNYVALGFLASAGIGRVILDDMWGEQDDDFLAGGDVLAIAEEDAHDGQIAQERNLAACGSVALAEQPADHDRVSIFHHHVAGRFSGGLGGQTADHVAV